MTSFLVQINIIMDKENLALFFETVYFSTWYCCVIVHVWVWPWFVWHMWSLFYFLSHCYAQGNPFEAVIIYNVQKKTHLCFKSWKTINTWSSSYRIVLHCYLTTQYLKLSHVSSTCKLCLSCLLNNEIGHFNFI